MMRCLGFPTHFVKTDGTVWTKKHSGLREMRGGHTGGTVKPSMGYDEYGVDWSTIRQIIKRKNWK